jgi:hypothetical protein
MVEIRLSRRRLEAPGFRLELRPGEVYRVVVVSSLMTVHLLEFEDAFFRTKSSVLLPELQEAPADAAEGETPPSTTGLVATCLQFAADHPDKKLLVTGHTDTTGSDEYNIPLSRNRAWAVHSAIAGDREGFKEACDGPHLTGKQEKTDVTLKDRLQILDWVSLTFGWPCGYAENGYDYFSAVRSFQKSYNDNGWAGNPEGEDVAVDGDWGKKTWGAVFDCYEARLAESLGVERSGLDEYRSKLRYVDANTPYAGCGEFHPIDNLGADNYRSQANRRVEINFFDEGEEPALECCAGGCAERACVLYDQTRYRREHLPPGGVTPAAYRVRIRLLDVFARPIPCAPFEIELGGAQQQGEADEDGWATIASPPEQPTPAKIRWGFPPEEGESTNLAYSIELTVARTPPAAESDEDGAARRLKALGYWRHEQLKHNVLLFQLAYGLPQTGEVADIKDDLWTYHDTGTPDPLPTEGVPDEEP